MSHVPAPGNVCSATRKPAPTTHANPDTRAKHLAADACPLCVSILHDSTLSVSSVSFRGPGYPNSGGKIAVMHGLNSEQEQSLGYPNRSIPKKQGRALLANDARDTSLIAILQNNEKKKVPSNNLAAHTHTWIINGIAHRMQDIIDESARLFSQIHGLPLDE